LQGFFNKVSTLYSEYMLFYRFSSKCLFIFFVKHFNCSEFGRGVFIDGPPIF